MCREGNMHTAKDFKNQRKTLVSSANMQFPELQSGNSLYRYQVLRHFAKIGRLKHDQHLIIIL